MTLLYQDGKFLRPCSKCRHLGEVDKTTISSLGEIGRRCGQHRFWQIYRPAETNCGQWEDKDAN